MNAKKRLALPSASILMILTLLTSRGISPVHAQSSVHSQQLLPAVTQQLYNNVSLGRPKWWKGYQCDSKHYNNDTVHNPNGLQAAPLGLTTYRGVVPCGPMPLKTNVDVSVNFTPSNPNAPQENEWECTELVKRYLYQAFGAPDLPADGKDVVATYTNPANNTLFQRFQNTNPPTVSLAPVAGDVLSFDAISSTSDSAGHTALVYKSNVNAFGNGPLKMLSQNNPHDAQGTGLLYVGNPNGADPGNPAWHVDTEKGYLGVVTSWLHPRTFVSSLNPSSTQNMFNAVSAFSANNIWAVGTYNSYSNVLIEHWNGASWTLQTGANPGTTFNVLYGVKALSATNVWAVGTYTDANGTHTLIEHYDGSRWTQDTVTGSYQGGYALYAIDGDPLTGDAWAVGADISLHPLTLHLSSGLWKSVSTSADASSQTTLYGVSEDSSDHVWVVGDDYYSGDHTFTMYDSGIPSSPSWTTYSSPNPGSSGSILRAVINRGSSGAWAVGYEDTNAGTAILMHWNGSAWSSAIILSLGTSSILYGVAALNSNNIWAVGTYHDLVDYPLIWHTSDGGSTWAQVPTDSSVSWGYFHGITIDNATGNTWAAGYYTNNGGHTLTEFFN